MTNRLILGRDFSDGEFAFKISKPGEDVSSATALNLLGNFGEKKILGVRAKGYIPMSSMSSAGAGTLNFTLYYPMTYVNKPLVILDVKYTTDAIKPHPVAARETATSGPFLGFILLQYTNSLIEFNLGYDSSASPAFDGVIYYIIER